MKHWKPGLGRVFLSRGLGAPFAPGRSRLARMWGLLLLLGLVTGLWAVPVTWAAATGAQQQTQQGKQQALHGQSWAFGQSEDRKDAIWRRGVPAQSLKQKAVTGSGAARQKATGGKSAPARGAMDTGDAIERALSAAEAASRAAEAKTATEHSAKPKGSLGLSMKDSTTTWNVTPMREAMRPDEVLVRDRQHVVRAFADVEPTEDLSIRVGPELILKDEKHGAESAGSSQPDSALGLGMQFKLDF